MSAGTERSAAESIAVKSAYVIAFLVSAFTAYAVSQPLRHWVIASYPNASHWLIHAVIGLLIAAPIFVLEDRFLVRKTGRDVFGSVRPVTIGMIVGYATPYALVA